MKKKKSTKIAENGFFWLQVAIAFRTPSYRTQQIEQPVPVFIQLQRHDGVTSEALRFEMLPLGSGRPAFWSLRKAFARKKADYTTFNKIMASEAAAAAATTTSTSKYPRNLDKYNNNNNEVIDAGRQGSKMTALRALNDLYNLRNMDSSRMSNSPVKAAVDFENNALDEISGAESRGNATEKFFDPRDPESCKIDLDNELDRDLDCGNIPKPPEIPNESKTLINGAEVDKSRTDWFDYSEVGKWVEKGQEIMREEAKNEDEDSSKSLKELLSQVAELDEIYEDTRAKVVRAGLEETERQMEIDVCDNQTYTSLQMAMKNPIQLLAARNDPKYEDVAMCPGDVPILPPPLVPKRDPTREPEERLPPLPPKRIRKMPSMPVLSRISSSQTIGDTSSEAPHKNLPSLPGTLLKPSKQGIFSKLFAKKNKKDNKDVCPGNFLQTDATNSEILMSQSKNNINEISGGFPRPSMTSVMSLRSFELNGDENPLYGMELTEAEHYALYTAMAPHATTSEFDEMSFYYSPVEGGKILTEAKQS